MRTDINAINAIKKRRQKQGVIYPDFYKMKRILYADFYIDDFLIPCSIEHVSDNIDYYIYVTASICMTTLDLHFVFNKNLALSNWLMIEHPGIHKDYSDEISSIVIGLVNEAHRI